MKPTEWILRVIAIFCSCIAIAAPAQAHKASDSYLMLRVTDSQLEGQWDIALRDLEMAVGLDGNGDGALTWDEIRARHAAIAAYALSRLALSSDGRACRLNAGEQLIDHHTDGAYAVLRFTGNCSAGAGALNIGYSLLFDLDPQHRGLLKLENGAQTTTAIFSPDRAQQSFNLGQAGSLGQFTDYFTHGAWHIWIGFDHILFLLSLLLPAVLVLQNRKWQASASFKASSIDVLKIVTAFTVAHSITLTLATIQVIELPSRWIEAAIAASVVIAALNNLLPVFHRQRWVAAFVFGLIHGFGFANVLVDLGLPGSALALALVAFNLGVEAGQLVIVAAFLPIAYGLRQTWVYRHLVFTAGSAAIILIGAVWLLERSLDIQLLAKLG